MSKRKKFTIGNSRYEQKPQGHWIARDGRTVHVFNPEGLSAPLANAYLAALDEIERLEADLASAAAQRATISAEYVAMVQARVNAEVPRLEQSDDDGYTWRFADTSGPIEDRECEVYSRGEMIGSAPDRPSTRALIERHRQVEATLKSLPPIRKTPITLHQGVIGGDGPRRPQHHHIRGEDIEAALQAAVASSIASAKAVETSSTEPTKPAGLSDEERAAWISSINNEIRAPHPSATYILRNIRRIVERLP